MRLAAIGALLSMIGCAGYRSGDLDEHRAWPPAMGSNRPSVSLAVFGRYSIEGTPQLLLPEIFRQWVNSCSASYLSSGIFSEVRPAGSGGDSRVDIELSVDKTFSKPMALIWELTLFLVPCTETFQYSCRTTFRETSGNLRGVIEKKGGVVILNELFLLFAAPFSTPSSAEKAVLDDLCRSTLLDAVEQGMVKP